ncbi:hypothetical protein Pcinc_027828 [Petrolisthes cinctipes]|uniref:Uncharacterized protein n=1 Tax=Petrolisthes cinctipes TaxID=88211 RepID=A0AAE1F4W3_PETCI|nr:hypothetical protein Pcinc_027828 [Petrolisthes cinctipes]
MDYGSFVPEALKSSDNPTLATLGKNLYLGPVADDDDIYIDLRKMVLQGDHALIVTVDYLIFMQYKRKLTHLTYIMEDKIVGDGVLNLGHLQGAFILLVLGIGVAFPTLLLERGVGVD